MPNPRGDNLVRPLALAAALALASILVGCTPAESASRHQTTLRPIKITELGPVSAPSRDEYPGVVQAAQTAQLAFEVPGRIVSMPVKEGQRVRKGAIIARLDVRTYAARVASAAARLREAQASFIRARNLYEARHLPAARLDRQRAARDIARATYREVLKLRQDAVLRAPFSGEIARKYVKNFANVQAKQPIVVLVDTSSLEVTVNLPEQTMARSKGASTKQLSALASPQVVIAALPGQLFPARLKEQALLADAVTRTFKVTLTFQRPEGQRIMPGMTAKVVVTRPRSSKTVSIPARAAVSDAQGQPFVWVVDRGTMRVSRRPVKLGELVGHQVTIRDGLKGDEWIATSGVHVLRPGMKVARLIGPVNRGEQR